MKLQKYCLVILLFFSMSIPALAEVDWTVDKSLDLKAAIKDITTSFDGKTLFVLTSKNELVMYDDSGRNQGSIKVDPGMDKILLSGFQKAGVPEQVFVSNSSTGQVQKLSFSVVAQIDVTGSPFLGNPEAPVAMVVFSDFQ